MIFDAQWKWSTLNKWEAGVTCGTCKSGFVEYADELVRKGARSFAVCDACDKETEVTPPPKKEPPILAVA